MKTGWGWEYERSDCGGGIEGESKGKTAGIGGDLGDDVET